MNNSNLIKFENLLPVLRKLDHSHSSVKILKLYLMTDIILLSMWAMYLSFGSMQFSLQVPS